MINVHTSVSKNSVPYFEYMVANMRRLARDPEALRFYAHCIDRDSESMIAKTGDPSLTTVSAYGTSGSGAHAVAAKSALLLSKKLGETNIIADSDTVVLQRAWDATTMTLLESFGVIGTTAEAIGGFSSGTDRRQLCKGVPNIAWFAMASRYDFSEIDMAPQKHLSLPITTPALSEVYGLPIGYEVLCDVGWQIPQYLKDRNINYLGFTHVKPTRGAKAITSGNDYHEEYQLPDGTPFIAHQRGSMKHPFRKNEISAKFYDCVDSYTGNLT